MITRKKIRITQIIVLPGAVWGIMVFNSVFTITVAL